MSSVTQVTNLVNTSWASTAVENATSTSNDCCVTCSILGSSAPSPLTGQENNFNLPAAGEAMGSVSAGLASAGQSLGIVAALQSITGGVAELGYNTSTAVLGLIQGAIASGESTAASSLLRLATSLAAASGGASSLFSGAFGMAAAGTLAGGDTAIGRVLSGSLGSLQSSVPGLNLLGSVPPSLVALSPESSALASGVASAGAGACVIPPSITPSDLATQYPAGVVSGLPGPNVSGGLAALASQLTTAVDSLVESVIGDAVTAFPVLFGAPRPGTGPRAQGLPIVDGEAAYAPAAAAPLGSASASAAPSASGAGGAATPGSLLSGAGVSAPSAGDIAQAAFSNVAAGGADFADLLAGGLSAGVSLLAGACATASALGSLLGAAVSAIEAASAIPADVLAALEAIASSLEEQAASYLAALNAAYAAAEAAAARLASLLNANTVLALLGDIVAAACQSGGSASASSLVGVI
jgi:hypothetical protein